MRKISLRSKNSSITLNPHSPKEDSHLFLYLSITERATSLVLVQEIDKASILMYFVSQVFKGDETCYQKIEKLTLVIVAGPR